MLQLWLSVLLLCPLFFCGANSVFDPYTDSTDNKVYYFWPYQEPPFDTLDIFFNAPSCADPKTLCTIKIIPCDVGCVPGQNCSSYNNVCSTQSLENYPLNLATAIVVKSSNIHIKSADPLFAQDIVIIPQNENIYNLNPKTICVAFQVESVDVSFSNLNIMIFEPECMSPAFSVLATTPLVYKKGGTVNIKNVTWNATSSLALFYNEASTPLHITTNGLSGSNANYDVVLLNVQATISAADLSRFFVYGTLVNSSSHVPLISHTLDMIDFTFFGCPPEIQYTSNRCKKRKAENTGLSVTLGILIGLMVYIGFRYCYKHFKHPQVFEHLPSSGRAQKEEHPCK